MKSPFATAAAFASWPRRLLAACAIAALLMPTACNLNSSDSDETTPTPSAGGLQTFSSRQAMADYLKGALAAGATPTEQIYLSDAVFATTASSAATASGAAFSATNLQEAGVDEADRLKSDGRHLFLIGRATGESVDRLRVRELTFDAPASATRNAGSREIAQLALPSGASYSRAYLARQRPSGRPDLMIAVGESEYWYSSPPVIGQPVATVVADWFAPSQWSGGRSEFQLIDLTSAAAPTLGKRVSLDGHLVASRRIGETLYVVSRYYPQVANAQNVTLDQLLPKWSVDGVVQGNLVDADRCYLPAGTTARPSADLIVVSAIDLAAPTAAPKTRCLAGASEAVYVSPESLYVATTRYDYNVQATEGRLWASYTSDASTDLHKFALSDSGPQYKGSGNVTGHLGWEQDKKSFRMGEHNGVLRVVTSLGIDWNGSATTRLTLLREGDGKLDAVATLPNAARPEAIGKPGERLYAARFVGNRAYLVTFRLTDPLYVLDLANPADPKIAGELSIPGYSDYLHPIGERWLIGVGKDAVVTGTAGDGRGAFYQGVKVALFDVGNAAAPREVNSLVIGKRGSDSAALHDHHAFSFLASSAGNGALGLLVLPVVRNETPAYGDPTSPTTWYDWTATGLQRFDVSESGLVARSEMVAEARASGTAYPQGNATDDRGFLIGDEVHYLHGMDVMAQRW